MTGRCCLLLQKRKKVLEGGGGVCTCKGQGVGRLTLNSVKTNLVIRHEDQNTVTFTISGYPVQYMLLIREKRHIIIQKKKTVIIN